MNISFSSESFKGVKLFVATPMYGGMCNSNYLTGMVDLFSACTAYGVLAQFHATANQSIVARARNDCADAFLQSGYTHLLFIDSDVGFTAKDALTLLFLAASDTEKQYDILAGPYPKKNISWKKIKCAVEKGLADKDPESLSKYVGNYTFLAPPNKPFTTKTPSEVLEIGTGFMLIPRKTFENFADHYPDRKYTSSDEGDRFAFFDCIIHPETRRYIGEDSMFCIYVRKMGGRVWVAPWLELTHRGSYTFEGSLAHVAATGMSPADV